MKGDEQNTPTIKFIASFVALLILSIVNGHVFQWLEEHWFPCDLSAQNMGDLSESWKFVMLVMFAPVVETYVFIQLPIELLGKMNVRREFYKVIGTATLFCSIHFYCWIYMAMTFVGGLMMTTLYFHSIRGKMNPFLTVTTFHALYNLYGYLFVVS